MLTLKKGTLLEIVLAGAKNTNDCPWTISYKEDADASRAVEKTVDGSTDGTTVVSVLTGNQDERTIAGFSLYNADLAAITFNLRYQNVEGTERTIGKFTLQTLEAAYWTPNGGWEAVDVNGNRKTNQPASSGAASTANSAADSAGTAASTADSKGVSSGTRASVADSKALSVSTVVSSLTSRVSSKGG